MTKVLSLNARALQYTHRNSQEAIQIANKKLATKRRLQTAGIPTPRLFAQIATRSDLQRFAWTKLPSSFVIKPNSAYGGGGIMVIFGRNRKGNWVKADKTEIFIPALRAHLLDIIDGNFSRGNIPDLALFEQRVKNHPTLKPYCVRGLPDIRVLLYNHIPVMAELRLPTEESGGRANLHAGGIGVGLDLATGRTTTAIQYDRLIETLPGSRLPLAGLVLPYWSDILLIAIKASQVIGLNYTGIDVTIDRDDGPLVLEVNARPGLSIQLANMTPLLSRLRRIEDLTVGSPEHSLQLATNLFAQNAHDLPPSSAKKILGIEESVDIIGADGQTHSVLAKIDTGAYRTALDTALAKKLGLHQPVLHHKEIRAASGQQLRPIINLSFRLRGHLLKTKASLTNRSHMTYDIIIGRRDLKDFLVDPNR
jgi:alpha-L-glutamate ligase-like protein